MTDQSVRRDAARASTALGETARPEAPSNRIVSSPASGRGRASGGSPNQTERIETSGAGTLIPGARQTLDYNDFDMPWRITSGQGEAAVPVELEYAADGHRLIKRQLAGESSDITTALTVDIAELYQQVSEFSSGVLMERRHHYRIFAAGRQVAQVNKVERGGAISNTETQVYYLHDDQLGTTSVITDSNGELVESRQFTPFGEEITPIDWNGSRVLSGFTGHRHDPELGLINMRGRLYDSRLSRFVTPDPFVTEPFNPQGLNRYSYVQNNPLTFVDPSGFNLGCPSGGCYPPSGGEPGSGSGGSSAPPGGQPSYVTDLANAASARAAAEAQARAQAEAYAAQQSQESSARAAAEVQAARRAELEAQSRMQQELLAGGMRQPGLNGPLHQPFYPDAPFIPGNGPSPADLRSSNLANPAAGAAAAAAACAVNPACAALVADALLAVGATLLLLPDAITRTRELFSRLSDDAPVAPLQARKADIKEIDAIAGRHGLTPGQRRRLHDEISRQDLTLEQIEQIAKEISTEGKKWTRSRKEK